MPGSNGPEPSRVEAGVPRPSMFESMFGSMFGSTSGRLGPVLAITVLAIGLRVAWVLLVPTRPVGDFALYVESAAHLVEHHGLDAEFIYMPGYVFLLAGVQALGGGLVACKLAGAIIGGLGTPAVHGIASRLAAAGARTDDRDRGGGAVTAAAAALLYAAWPAGIAVASVTGTDMPAAVVLAAAVAALVRADDAEDGRAARRSSIFFALLLGLAAYVRAVALPLALLALPVWLARGARWRAALARTALACGVAFVVLLPWGIRNRTRYGEFFLTDSHGGHTALVGANPNSEGVYSRSLNQMFTKGTGYRLLDPSPRDADRAAYALARSWAAFEPAYAAGLVAAKADRLLTHERGLLYWPLYRQSVLRDPPRGFFDRHRAGIEALVDDFWYLLAGAALAGLGLAVCRRRWLALAIALFPAALIALYATFFSEVRYHLAIAIFMFPYAALALRWLVEIARDAVGARAPRPREAIAVVSLVAVLFLGWPRLLQAAAAVRDRHRWAVCVCVVAGRSRLCDFRATAIEGSRSPLRGVWNGVGLRAAASGAVVAAETRIDLPPGRYHLSARADAIGAAPAPAEPSLRASLRASGRLVAVSSLRPSPAAAPTPSTPVLIEGDFDHPGGALPLSITVDHDASPRPAEAPAATVWLGDINIEPDPR